MKQSYFSKRFYSKSLISSNIIQIIVYSVIFSILISFKIRPLDDRPVFIVNAITRVPSSFKTLPNIEEFTNAVDELPYYVEKDTNATNPSRGKIVQEVRRFQQNCYTTSSVLGTFFDKLSRESFGENAIASQTLITNHVKVAALLNRIKSVDDAVNQEFYSVFDDLPDIIEHKIILSLWEPQWMKKVTTEGGIIKNIPVDINEVSQFYNNLKIKNPLLAHAFIQIQENQLLNSIVPYRELREVLLKDEATRSLVRSSRAKNPRSPVYITFMDNDVIALRTGSKGVFNSYENTILKSQVTLHGLTTGYSVSTRQNPHVSLAVSLDLANRRALSTVFSLAPYFPEPNTAIRVMDNTDTLEVSFPEIKLNGHAHYTSPQEMPLLIEEIIKTRFSNSKTRASEHFKFIHEGDIETEAPMRFMQNRKKKNGTKNTKQFSAVFDRHSQQLTSITLHDLKQVRNTSQSQLKTRDWSGLVYKYLEEFLQPESIKIVDTNQPGSLVSKRKNLFLISMFSSIHSAYSPLAITIREVKKNGYNTAEYLYSLITDYERRVPTSLNITYGTTKNTKITGDLIRTHLTSYEDLNGMINKFYTLPVAKLITDASLICGRSEIPVLMRYIQFNFNMAVPKVVLNIKVEEATRSPKLVTRPQRHTPKKELKNVYDEYPKVHLSLPNIKTLLKSLYTRVTYSAIDNFVGLPSGNVSRIVNRSTKLSANVQAIWEKFNTSNWDVVLQGLSISLQDLVLITNSNLTNIRDANKSNANFLDAFFCLKK